MYKNNNTATVKVERSLLGFLLHTSTGLLRQPSLKFSNTSANSCHRLPWWIPASCKYVGWIRMIRAWASWMSQLLRLGLMQPMIQVSRTYLWCSAIFAFFLGNFWICVCHSSVYEHPNVEKHFSGETQGSWGQWFAYENISGILKAIIKN